MNYWWLFFLLPMSAAAGFFLCAVLTISARTERMVLLEREIDWLRDQLDEALGG